MFDLPEPFKPVIALNLGSKPDITVLVEYDLKPSNIISSINILWREFLKKFKSQVKLSNHYRFDNQANSKTTKQKIKL